MTKAMPAHEKRLTAAVAFSGDSAERDGVVCGVGEGDAAERRLDALTKPQMQRKKKRVAAVKLGFRVRAGPDSGHWVWACV